MSRLSNCSTASCCSPRAVDMKRVENVDADGVSFVSFVPCDLNEIRKSNGSVSLWSLDSLVKAGIDPKFGIHTGNNTRLEGVQTVADASAVLDSILSSEKSE